jgi:hypothetical protein
MKTVEIEITRKAVAPAYVQVPDHWSDMDIRRALVRHHSALMELAEEVDFWDTLYDYDVHRVVGRVETADLENNPTFTFPEAA